MEGQEHSIKARALLNLFVHVAKNHLLMFIAYSIIHVAISWSKIQH
jgi:hypothetical protein